MTYEIYMHVPFCHTLCTYCTFHRFLFKEYKAREYFKNLRAEMQMAKDLGYDFQSVYVGGGTTTILQDELIQTLELARKLFPHIREISCETDPKEIASPLFKNLQGLVDRMSIGVQSFDDSILKLTDRTKFGTGAEVYDRIAACQDLFPTCNVDMMFGFRGQSLDMIARDMELIRQLNPKQVTTYPLMVTSETRKSVKGMIAAEGQELSEQYNTILGTLGQHYRQLTSWTFGRTGDNEGIDEYVIDHDEYLGIGSGAFSFLGDSLYVNTFSLARYGQRIQSGQMGTERRREFTKHQILQYRLMLSIFAGRLSRKYFREVQGVNLDTALLKEMLGLRLAGAIRQDPTDPDKLTVTTVGKFLGLVMMKAFYSGMDNVRAQLRAPLKACDM